MVPTKMHFQISPRREEKPRLLISSSRAAATTTRCCSARLSEHLIRRRRPAVHLHDLMETDRFLAEATLCLVNCKSFHLKLFNISCIKVSFKFLIHGFFFCHFLINMIFTNRLEESDFFSYQRQALSAKLTKTQKHFLLTSPTYFSVNWTKVQRNLRNKNNLFLFLDSCVCNLLKTSLAADTEPGRRDRDSPLVKCECLGRDKSRFMFGAEARELKEARNDGEAQQR